MKLIFWVLFVAAIGWAAWHFGGPAVADMRTKNNSSSHYTPCMVGDYIAC